MEKEVLRIPEPGRRFEFTNIRERIEEGVDEYNAIQGTMPDNEVNKKLFSFAGRSHGTYQPNEFARALGILLFAREGRANSGSVWNLCVDNMYEIEDWEFCREVMIRAIKECGKDNVRGYLISLTEESADEDIQDILGMIMDELGELSDEEYGDLMDDFCSLLVQWRKLEVPKCKDADAYELVYELVRRCYEHKAYRTATRLSGLLYVADERKKKPNLAKTNLLMGKVMYELGYMEIAKRCFMFADEDTKGECWKDVPEKYRELLDRETKLEITEEVLEKQKFVDDGIASGKIKTYTKEEVDLYYKGKLNIEFPDPENQRMERKKVAKKALEIYDKYADCDDDERLKGIDEAFGAFTEETEVYPEATYLHYLKAQIYRDKEDLENAYACIKKAYAGQNGDRNGNVLITMAFILSNMGREYEAKAYVFRTYILLGEEYLKEMLNDPMGLLEDYI